MPKDEPSTIQQNLKPAEPISENVGQLKRKVKALQQSKRRITQVTSAYGCPNNSTTHKLAQRVKKKLPKAPNKCPSTVMHVLKTASPKKKNVLIQLNKTQKKSPSEVQGTNQTVIEAEGTQLLTAR